MPRKLLTSKETFDTFLGVLLLIFIF